MNKYLIFVEAGGMMEDGGRLYNLYYTICEGSTELEAMQDWAYKNKITEPNFYKSKNGDWVDRGYVLQIVNLYENIPSDCGRQKLKWV